MPLPDGRTFPEPVEVASLPFSWSVGLSAPPGGTVGGRKSSAPQVSAVGYYDAQSADGAPTELQVVARAAGGTIAVMTARVHRANARGRFVFRNTRSVVLPLGQSSSAGSAPGISNREAGSSRKPGGRDNAPSEDGLPPGGHWDVEGIPHPNLPLIARLSVKGGWAVEVDSWVNGGSHLQCIPCKPRDGESSQLGHTAGGEPERANGAPGSSSMGSDSSSDSSSGSSGDSGGSGGKGGSGDARGKDRVAPVFGELAQKVRSGDELSFVPYSLPSLTLGCSESLGKEGDAKAGAQGKTGASGYSGAVDRRPAGGAAGAVAGSTSNGAGQGGMKHALWLADWVGAEALPPALAVIDADSRLHVFELDDGASSSESPPADGAGAGAAGPAGFSPGAGSGVGSGWGQARPEGRSGRPGSTKSTGSMMSLSHSDRHLHLKGFMEDSKGADGSSSPEMMSRRARAEFGGAALRLDRAPLEKTVVLPLDSKYGLGLTLAFEDSRVRGCSVHVSVRWHPIRWYPTRRYPLPSVSLFVDTPIRRYPHPSILVFFRMSVSPSVRRYPRSSNRRIFRRCVDIPTRRYPIRVHQYSWYHFFLFRC